MKLWLLKARTDLPKENNPWAVWYDKMFSLVVVAKNESEARQIATACDGFELHKGFYDKGSIWQEGHAWLSPEYSTCEMLTVQGVARVVIRDVREA